MNSKNRNNLLIIMGVLLLVVCCCSIVAFSGIFAFLTIAPASQSGSFQTGPEEIVVVEAATISAGAPNVTATLRPTARASTGAARVTAPAAPGRTPTPGPAVAAAPTPQATLPGAITPGRAPAGTSNVTPGAGIRTTTLDSNAAILAAKAAMPERDQRDLALRLKPDLNEIPEVVNATPPTFKLNDKDRFWVSNSDTLEHRQITATLRVITPHVYMWVEDGVDLNLRDLQRSAERFETQTYPTNREFFGSEWTPGVDNDVHLSILHARGLGRNIAGYYSSADQFSNLVNQYSNQREMFYISAEGGQVRPNTSFYDGVLAHEFQHMIHWANDRNEDSWVNEGMSELAGHLNGFDTGGAEYAYAEQPDTQLTTWNDPSLGNAEHYGASYLFMNYFLGRFGENLTKAVVSSPENSTGGFDHALQEAGLPERFDDIFADWLIANYLDSPDANPQGRFGYSEIDPPTPAPAQSHSRFPASERATVSQYGADYIALGRPISLTIDFTGQTTVSVVNASPKGRYSWWSNRGDDSDSTLTRAVDLRQATSAVLTFSLWYDIEEGWDYAYLQVSTDGGKKWHILPGRHTTTENPSGNAFGAGWTGLSGGGQTARWIQESIDLSTYAGQEILLRFEYVTDDAVNGPGFLLDDIAISQTGFSDDAENGPGDWQAAGWVLTDNVLTQTWLVQLVTVSGTTVRVERMPVGLDGKGQLKLSSPSPVDRAVLIVSGLAPVTTEKASYSYSISGR